MLELQPPASSLVAHEDHRARHVRRHEVGRELHARELQPGGYGHRAHEERLAEPWRAFQQHVPAGDEADQELVDDLVLPEDDAADLPAQALQAA